MLTIARELKEDTLLLSLNGRLDTLTAQDLEAELRREDESYDKLILDFAGVDYISSAGLRVLLSAQRKLGRTGSMKITHVGETVSEIFEITGFCDILNIE